MSQPTNSVIIREWSDDPESGRDADGWPYPNYYTESLITGELADKIRARLEAHPEAPVIFKETCESGGYSEYTQENDYTFELRVNGYEINIPGGGYCYDNGINSLIKWLDAA